MNYEDLAEPTKWKGQIAIRQANNVYNQSLVASLIENNGHGLYAMKWFKRFWFIISLAQPQGNDRRANSYLLLPGESELGGC